MPAAPTDPLERPGVRAAVERWLGEVSGSDTTIVDVRRPTAAGSSHDVTFLTARVDGVAEDLVLRRDPDDHPLFLDADLGREAKVLELLQRIDDVPVPALVGFNPDPSVLGTPYLVMARVPGDVAPDDPPYNSSGWMADADPTERRDLWDQALRMMSRVGAVDPSRFLELFPDRRGLHAELDFWRRNTLWASDGSPSPTIAAALDHLFDTAPPDDPAALSWGDSRIGNILFDDGRAAAIIDWEMASLGGAHLDVGWWLMTDLVHSDQMGCERLAGLGTRSETIATWCEATGLDADTIEWHEAFAALRLGVTVGRVMNVAHRRGLLPDEYLPMADDNFGTRILAQLLPVPPPGASHGGA